MRIKKVELKNFKFHHHLEFTLEKSNCLIYGENGTGKSSIYEALYSNFYYYKNKDIANNIVNIRDKFLHRDNPTEHLEVNVMFDDEQALIRIDEDLNNHELLVEDSNIYFSNEKVLSSIVDENFFNVINNILVDHFPKLMPFQSIYSDVKIELHSLSENIDIRDTTIIQMRMLADELCNRQLTELIPIEKINEVLKDSLLCDFQIEFSFKNSIIDIYNIFHSPIISLKINGIDDRDDFKNHFNEAKLKLISIAIYFTLARHYETSNSLKLLVLDDFLTSLDMANRKIIARYILDDFKEYQIILLTHNIQFNNLTKKLIEKDAWNIKHLFTLKENGQFVAKIKDRNDNYIDEAKRFIQTDDYNLEIAGNLLRKAFESIVSEFEQLLEIGKVENMKHIIDALKSHEAYFYNKPHDVLSNLISDFENMLQNELQPNDAKIRQIRSKINQISNNKITFKHEETADRTYNILTKAEFYKNILMNPSSHDDSESEKYKQECENTILLLEELNLILSSLKSNT